MDKRQARSRGAPLKKEQPYETPPKQERPQKTVPTKEAPREVAPEKKRPHTEAAVYNTILVGAGPIGIEIAMNLKRHSVDYLHLEAGQIGHSIMRWTPQTVFYSSPEWIALCGVPIQSDDQQQITGEHYLAYLRQLVETFDLAINTFEKVVRATPLTDALPDAPQRTRSGEAVRFLLTTESNHGRHEYYTRNIILAVGNMQQYNRISIPGDELPSVSYTLANPHTYFRKKLLIVGGKNSALEAALRCWRAGAEVTISYRNPHLTNKGVLDRIFLELQLLIKNKKIRFLAPTLPIKCTPTHTTLERLDTKRRYEIASDFVYIAVGYTPDYSLYHDLGVNLLGAKQSPEFNPATMETNVRGVYVAGTAAAGNETYYTVFITTCHPHVAPILSSITAQSDIDVRVGNHHTRDYPLQSYDLE